MIRSEEFVEWKITQIRVASRSLCFPSGVLHSKKFRESLWRSSDERITWTSHFTRLRNRLAEVLLIVVTGGSWSIKERGEFSLSHRELVHRSGDALCFTARDPRHERRTTLPIAIEAVLDKSRLTCATSKRIPYRYRYRRNRNSPVSHVAVARGASSWKLGNK